MHHSLKTEGMAQNQDALSEIILGKMKLWLNSSSSDPLLNNHEN